jgi:hypothetical protein
MSNPNAKRTARRVDTNIGVIGTLSIHASVHVAALITRVSGWMGW